MVISSSCQVWKLDLQAGKFSIKRFGIPTHAMSKQKLSAKEREAIWLAHGGKCAYTRESLDMSNFHIENVTYQDQVESGLLKVTGVGQNWFSCEDDALR